MERTGIWVLGGHQTDFARNRARAGLEFADLTREVVDGALAAAGVGPDAVEVIHVGNAFGRLFTGQGRLGGMPATVEPGLWGVPAARHEAACASGGVAVLAAMADLEAGRYDRAQMTDGGAGVVLVTDRRPRAPGPPGAGGSPGSHQIEEGTDGR
ncbi:hypothetical protein ACFQU9_11855 [Actinomadura namibiensis]|uniref:thiolase family protein n=1 Tax=Actinomadura kijaniata TaxID=46161 RepID=UPI003622530B